MSLVTVIIIVFTLLWITTLWCLIIRNTVFWWKRWGCFIESNTTNETDNRSPKKYNNSYNDQTTNKYKKPHSTNFIKNIEKNARTDYAHYCYFSIPVILLPHITRIIRRLKGGSQPKANKTHFIYLPHLPATLNK